MNRNLLSELLKVVQRKQRIDQDHTWSNGSETYFNEIQLELEEVRAEIESGRICYLEDELGDVLWDYLNLLASLEQEGRISLERVFERSLIKYRERIDGISQGQRWDEIKGWQKLRLAEEQAHIDESEKLV